MGARNSMKGMEAARKAAFILCCICLAGSCIFLAVWFVNGQSLKAKNRELAEQFHSVEYAVAEAASPQQAEAIAVEQRQKMAALTLKNEDAIAWIYIEGTEIDYPVVQHKDNEYYLNRNFWGEEDRYGAIFMDCANTDRFVGQHVILYGHNMKDGTMFGGLDRYLNADYLAENPIIEITLPDGDAVFYRIFAAREVYADDPSYQVDFNDVNEFAAFAAVLGAPEATTRLLTLSTCTNGADHTGRVLVHAALV